jgi:hypothetical protein
MVYSQTSTPSGQSKVVEVTEVKKVASKRQEGGRLIQEFSFLINDFKCDHQTEMHNLNISVSFRYVSNIAESDYPDFRLITLMRKTTGK